jgi:hypothetical protein
MKPKKQIEAAKPPSFKQRFSDLVQSVQEEAVAAAVKLGFTPGATLHADVHRESELWSAMGYEPVSGSLKAWRGGYWSRAICLSALYLPLDPMEYFGEDSWDEWMDEELNRLRARLDDAAPSCVDVSAVAREIKPKSSAAA